ncbi:4'-phosphopantetheinyl transferase [Hymenobacter sp. UYAg731]
MIELWYTAFPAALAPEVLSAHLTRLPPAWQRKVLGRRRAAGQAGTLFGALLLQHVLEQQPAGYGLAQVRHTADNRPYLPGQSLDFNISHAGRYAVCALSPAGRVGVDLDHRTRADLAPFAPHFAPAEWAALQAAPDPQRAFCRLWTQKEAVAKADGRGLNIPLRDIRIGPDHAQVAAARWHLQEVRVGAPYCLHVASSLPLPVAPLRRVRFETGLAEPQDL